jgi:hypothetical protein
MSRWAQLFGPRKRMMEDLDQDIRNYIERGMPPEGAHCVGLLKSPVLVVVS